MALTDKKRVKRFLGIDTQDTGHDDLIDDLIDLVSDLFRAECGQPVELTDYSSYTFEGTGSTTRTIEYRPVSNLTTLKEFSDGEWIELDAGTYRLLDSPYRIERDGGFTKGGLYRASFKVGYGAENIPATIRKAVRDRVIREYLASKPGGAQFGLSSMSTPVGDQTASQTFDHTAEEAQWKAAIKRHRVVVCG
jgi:hypothetical protein